MKETMATVHVRIGNEKFDSACNLHLNCFTDFTKYIFSTYLIVAGDDG